MTHNGHHPITTVCLVRHGETDWNATVRLQGSRDIPLNEAGREQARLVAAAIAGEEWDAIVSSPLSRALDTATMIAAALDIPPDHITVRSDLKERAYGAAEGTTEAERNQRWPNHHWPGLEAKRDLWRRCMAALNDVARRHAGERVIVVCHGGVINAVLAVISHGELGTGKTRLHNASLTRLHTDGRTWTIDEVDVTVHLEQTAAEPLPTAQRARAES
jgi:broad specificity phosphatase PhoE